MIAQPIESLNVKFTTEFLEFIRLVGVLNLAESIVKILQVFTGVQHVGTQQLLLIALIVINILYIQRYYAEFKWTKLLSMRTCGTLIQLNLQDRMLGLNGKNWDGCLEKLGKIGMYPSKLHAYNEYKEVSRVPV